MDDGVINVVHVIARSFEGAIYGLFLAAGLVLIRRKEATEDQPMHHSPGRIFGYALLVIASIIFWIYPWQIGAQLYWLVLSTSNTPTYQLFGLVAEVATCVGGFLAGTGLYRQAFDAARQDVASGGATSLTSASGVSGQSWLIVSIAGPFAIGTGLGLLSTALPRSGLLGLPAAAPASLPGSKVQRS